MVHPLLVAVVVVDGLGALLLAAAVATAVRVLLWWAPARATARQLRLEVASEGASILARAALWLTVLAALLSIVAVTTVLPDAVPGAMCGTGVLEATGGLGRRALGSRALALVLLGAWQLLDRLNRTHPLAPLSQGSARALLLAAPVAWLATFDSTRTMLALDVHRPVQCCAAIYDRVRTQAAGTGASMSDSVWVWGATLTGAALVVLAVLILRKGRSSPSHQLSLATAAVAVAWAVLATVALVRVGASYHYGVLAHHCPWCLFLPQHGAVGWPLLAALALVAFEGPAGGIAARVARRSPELATAAQTRARRAGWRVLAGTLLFAAIAGLPPLVYRWRFGTWLDGG